VLHALLDVLREVLMRCDALGRGFPNAMVIDQGNVGASTMRKPISEVGVFAVYRTAERQNCALAVLVPPLTSFPAPAETRGSTTAVEG
jgi:hypothetical protein